MQGFYWSHFAERRSANITVVNCCPFIPVESPKYGWMVGIIRVDDSTIKLSPSRTSVVPLQNSVVVARTFRSQTYCFYSVLVSLCLTHCVFLGMLEVNKAKPRGYDMPNTKESAGSEEERIPERWPKLLSETMWVHLGLGIARTLTDKQLEFRLDRTTNSRNPFQQSSTVVYQLFDILFTFHARIRVS